jgi:hypothetical protein
LNKELDEMFLPTFTRNFKVGGNSISMMSDLKTISIQNAHNLPHDKIKFRPTSPNPVDEWAFKQGVDLNSFVPERPVFSR